MTRAARLRSLLDRVAELDAALRSFDNVHHVDVGFRYKDGARTDGLAARIFIRGPKRARGKARNLAPKRLHGVSTDVISARFTPHCGVTPEPKRISVAPWIVGGISIAQEDGGAGTAGVVVKSRRFDGPQVLTCDHVAREGQRVFQPAQVDSPHARPVGVTSAVSLADVASLVEIRGVPVAHGAVLGLPDVTGVVTRDELIALCARRAVVKKSGRSTGVTIGELDGLGSTGTVHIVKPPGLRQRELSCRGDSGAIWMTADGKAVAMHFEGAPGRANAQAMYLIQESLELVFDDGA